MLHDYTVCTKQLDFAIQLMNENNEVDHFSVMSPLIARLNNIISLLPN